jgi:hypothetical protein
MDIRIALRPGADGPDTYPALLVRRTFAVVCLVPRDGNCAASYSVTHIPSGMRAFSADTRKAAERACRMFARDMPRELDDLPWASSAGSLPPEVRRKCAAVVRKAREAAKQA